MNCNAVLKIYITSKYLHTYINNNNSSFPVLIIQQFVTVAHTSFSITYVCIYVALRIFSFNF